VSQFICSERAYEFQHFTTFGAAQEQWQQQPPTVAIIKRSLNTTNDGLAFCSVLRDDAHLSRLPIIIGWADMAGETFEEAYHVGANGCFGRVFDIGGVFTMIETLAREPAQTRLVDQVVPRRKQA